MMKKTVLIVFVLAVLIALVFAVRFVFRGLEDTWVCDDGIWTKHGNPRRPAPQTPCGNHTETKTPVASSSPFVYKDLIRIDSPAQNSKVSTTSPIKFSGAARGSWYFEATFPVQILDEDGKIIGTSTARAQGEWTKENLVPFEGEIKFEKPKGKMGKIIFKDDLAAIMIEFE